MKKTKLIIVILIAVFALIQCQKEKRLFDITTNKIGLITTDTNVSQIDSIYSNDSVVRQNIKTEFVTNNNIEIFEKGGNKLLSLEPKEEGDQSKIQHIQIFDERYLTDKNVGLGSTFKDFKDNYEIKSIERMINSIIVFFKDQPFYITISMDELPAELKFKNDVKIEALHIPDNAKIKYLMAAWD